MKKDRIRYVNLTNHLSFTTDIQKLVQHTGGKCLIHGTKHHNDNQLQSLELAQSMYVSNLQSSGIIYREPAICLV